MGIECLIASISSLKNLIKYYFLNSIKKIAHFTLNTEFACWFDRREFMQNVAMLEYKQEKKEFSIKFLEC